MIFLTKQINHAAAFFFIACIADNVNAQLSDDNAHEIEIGAGGNIKPEKPNLTEIEELFEWHAHLLWESRYITEGRDNLSGDSIASVSTEFSYQDVTVVPWFADSINTDYEEFNLNIVYGTKALDDLDVFVGYNHIQTRDSGNSGDDNEISIDLAYFDARKFQALTSIYHSFGSNGAFAEVAIKKIFSIDKSHSITIHTGLGFNAGYVVDGHRGLNHGQLRANFSSRIMKKMDAYAYIGYNLAINRDAQRYTGDELLRDFFWGGVGTSYRF